MALSYYKVLYTEPSINDLDKIIAYLPGFHNPIIIKNLQRNINEKLSIVSLNPELYEVMLQRHGNDYRKIIINGYILVYTVEHNKRVVYVNRFFHQLEDYQNKYF